MGLKIARISDAKTAEEFALRALRAYDAGDLEKAHANLISALELKPDDGSLFQQLGSVLIEQGQWTKALIAAKKSVELLPYDANSYNLLGCVLFKLRWWQLAELSFRRTLEFDSNHKGARPNLVEAIKMGKLEKNDPPSEFDGIKELLAVRQPTVALCMIVKNEEQFLGDCLESVQGAVDEICIVDTGSTDKTVEIAQKYGAKIGHFEWNGDFAAARNKSLEMATADWILILDADETITPESKEEIRRVTWDKTKIGYSCVIENLLGEQGDGSKQMALIFRFFQNRPDVRYEGRIHEQALPSAQRTGLPNVSSRIRIVHKGYLNKWLDERDKHQRNLQILLKQEVEEPTNPFCQFNLGQTYKLLNDATKSEEHYKRALEMLKAAGTDNSIPYYASLFFSYADLLRLNGRNEEALAIAEDGLSRFPTFADLHFTKGTILLAMERYDEALKVYESNRKFAGQVFAGGTDPGTSTYKATNAIGVCYSKLGKNALAKQYFKRALKEWPRPNAEIHANLGIIAMAESDLQAALRYFTSALEIDSGNFQCWLNLGAICYKQENLPEAVASWQQAAILDPKAAEVHFLIGEAQLKLGNLAAAQLGLEAELAISPDHPSSVLVLGIVQYLSGQLEEALATWQTFLERHPESDRLAEFRSAILFVQMAAGVAMNVDGLRSTQLAPDFMARQWTQLLDLAIQAKLFDQVEAIANKSQLVVEYLPNFDEQLGRIFLKWKIFDLAVTFLLRQRERTPENPELYFLLGEGCKGLEKPSDAAVMYDACLKLNPRHAMARSRLAKLEALPA